jgi:NADH dehydrogenase/NADH:ubiquinone oxidoreductase subunit G
MKRLIPCAIVLLAFACMQKQPDGSYKVTDTATSDAAKKVKEGAAKTGDQIKESTDEIAKSDAVQKIKNGSVEVGRGVKEGLGQAAQKAGAGLQKAGKKAEDEVKKTESKTDTH